MGEHLMPYYDYHCETCDKAFEVFQGMSEEPISTCPECGAEVRRVFDASSIIFKGSGFYKTDTRSNSGSNSTD